jgi:DNA-binding response OmpR family regulator
MLTANGEMETIVNCLNAGADQYLVKPYRIEELIARIEAVLRLYPDRTAINRKREGLPFPVNIDWGERKLIGRDGSVIRLTEKELSLLELFIAAGDSLLDREKSFSAIYDKEMDPFNRSIDILVSRLRKKLMVVERNSDIMTIRGRGYHLVMPLLSSEGGNSNE